MKDELMNGHVVFDEDLMVTEYETYRKVHSERIKTGKRLAKLRREAQYEAIKDTSLSPEILDELMKII